MVHSRLALATVVAVLATVITAVPASAVAETVTIDGVTYSADSSDTPAGAAVISAAQPPAALVIPDVVTIGAFDFAVTSIGDAAFQNSAVESAVIPAGVSRIGEGAFAGSAMTLVTFLGDAPAVSGEFGLGDADTAVRHLPDATGFTSPWSGGGATDYATAPLTRVVQVSTGGDRTSQVEPGLTIEVTGTGFVPGETITMELSSVVGLTTTVEASSGGEIAGTVTLPSATPSSSYELVVTGSLSGESRHEVTVLSATALTEPLNLRVTVNNGQALTLEWAPPASNSGSPVTDYVIQYKRSTSTTWLTVADGVSTGRTFTFVGPTVGVTFNFRVQAVTSDAASPFSGVVTATIPLATVTRFTPGFIIADQNFYDGDAMTESQIQSFLNARIGTCLSNDCLNVLRVDMPTYPAAYSTNTGKLICTAVQGGTGLRASTVIFRVQQACGVSAKVILVTLQKEQGLVTSRNPSNYALGYAMGWACPDSTGCVDPDSWFGYQVYRGGRQLVTYKLANFARQPGVHAIAFSPSPGCGSTNVTIANYATAALYNYTPYQPTAASLAAWPLAATPFSACNSYGNRNFWFYYNEWFGNPTTVATPPTTDEPTFRDVPSDRAFATEIEWLAASGITNGFSDGTFRPLGTVNRDAMAAFLYRLMGEPAFTPPATSPFTDVTPTTPFYKEITWLNSTGVAGGFSDGTFRPSRPVNRDAMAAFLFRLANPTDFTPPTVSPFSDVTLATPFAQEILWLDSTGITGGFNDGTFRPAQPVNRDAMAAFLFRFVEQGLIPD